MMIIAEHASYLGLITGLIAGSFLAALSYRLPRGIPMTRPKRSQCPSCRNTIAWWQNIPLLGYLLLCSKCYYCQAPISLRYPVGELAGGIAGVLLTNHFGISQELLYFLPLAGLLILISLIDAELRIIPNRLLVGGLIWLLAGNQIMGLLPWTRAITGALAAGGLLYLIRWLSRKLFRREGIGMGDVKFAAIPGFICGWDGFLAILFFASLLAIISYPLLRRFHSSPEPIQIPFAPYLSAATLCVLLWGELIWALYAEWLAAALP